MTQRFKYGDRVAWNTPQGHTLGRVAKRLTHATYVRGHKVDAPADPQYLVTTDRSAKKAAHKPATLKKRD